MFPSSWLFEHFLKRTGKSGRKVLSSNALAERIKSFSEPAALAGQFGSLDAQAQIACSCAYLFGNSGYRPESGESRADDPLVLSFLLYLARNSTGILKYFGFAEFERALRPILVTTLLDKGRRTGKFTLPESSPNCMNDITALLSLAGQGVLERKKQGELTKNALRRITDVIHAAPQRQDTEAYADFLLRFSLAQGVLRPESTVFRVARHAIEEWFSMHQASRQEELLEYAWDYAGGWNNELFSDLLQEAGDDWISIEAFPAPVRKETLHSLKILSWVGWIDLVKSGSEYLFRASAAPKSRPVAVDAGSMITLLPDFTAVLLGDTDPDTLYRFGQVGTLQSLDRVYRGTIERAVLNDSLTRGLGGDDALAWLAEWGAPSNVSTTVREWIREYNRLYLSNGPVLIATDQRVADEIASYEPLQSDITRLPAYAVFRVNPGAIEEIKNRLAGMGYDFRMPLEGEQKTTPVAGETAPAPEQWQPVTGAQAAGDADQTVLRGKKYGSGLKAFDLNETVNIIDYAILTSQEIEMDYAGSPLVKKGIYLVRPVSVASGSEPLLNATDAGSRTRQFHIRRIQRIGVGR